MNLKELISKLNKKKGDKSYVDFAKEIGIDQSGLFRIMTGKRKPSFETYVKISKFVS